MKNSFSHLIEGKKYSLHNKTLNNTNNVWFITGDYLNLNRDIAYFQFADVGQGKVTKQVMIKQFKNNCMPYEIFALWGDDLKNYTVTEIKPKTMKKKKFMAPTFQDQIIEKFKSEIVAFQKTFLDCTDLNDEQKEALQECVDSFKDEFDFEVEPEAIAEDTDLLNDVIWNIQFDPQALNSETLERVTTLIESGPYKVIKCESLAEVMKVEQFIYELTENPYQLNLI